MLELEEKGLPYQSYCVVTFHIFWVVDALGTRL